MAWRNKVTRDTTLKVLSENASIIIFDTETTGLTANDEIIELAAKKYRIENEGLKEVEVFHEYFKPSFYISPKIVEITGLTNEFLSDKPSWSEKFDEIKAFFSDTPIAAYNVKFDLGMMEEAYKREGEEYKPKVLLDVLEMARDCVPKGTTENYKLGTIAEHYGVHYGLTFHNALDDVTATERLFEIFINDYKEEEQEGAGYKIHPVLSRVGFWEGYRGFSRIYVQTNYGSVYYCIRTKTWETKDAPIDQLDMTFVEKSAWELVGAKDQKEFERFRGSVSV